jgi:hypothetical protein
VYVVGERPELRHEDVENPGRCRTARVCRVAETKGQSQVGAKNVGRDDAGVARASQPEESGTTPNSTTAMPRPVGRRLRAGPPEGRPPRMRAARSQQVIQAEQRKTQQHADTSPARIGEPRAPRWALWPVERAVSGERMARPAGWLTGERSAGSGPMRTEAGTPRAAAAFHARVLVATPAKRLPM